MCGSDFGDLRFCWLVFSVLRSLVLSGSISFFECWVIGCYSNSVDLLDLLLLVIVCALGFCCVIAYLLPVGD